MSAAAAAAPLAALAAVSLGTAAIAVLAALIQLAVGAILKAIRRHSFGEAVLNPLRDNHGINTS